MSRTDKTNPVWLDCEWQPVHRKDCLHRIAGLRVYDASSKKVNANLECDLPVNPPARWSRNYFNDKRSYCHWQPDWPSYYNSRTNMLYGRERYVKDAANRFERRIRARWRDYRQKALSSYICTEGISGCPCLYDVMNEVTPPDARGRHFALWDRW